MLENIFVNKKSKVPYYLQIKNQIESMIRDGTIPGHAYLLPSREMAESLAVSRTTIVAAYNELLADGLVEARVGRGTMVRDYESLTAKAFAGRYMNPQEWFTDIPRLVQDPVISDTIGFFDREDVISFTGGVPSPDLLPYDELKESLARVLRKNGKRIFQQVAIKGHYPLREVISQRLRRTGKPISIDEILIVSGSMQGLYLLTKILINPGDSIIVESPTSTAALKTFRLAKARMIDIPVDEHGMRIDILEKILSKEKPKVIYTLPTFQNPSGVTMSLERRKKILEMAYQYGVLIIEEDPYREIYFDKDPPPSLKSMDIYDHVIYLNTVSKTISFGLRIGWVIASKPIIHQLSIVKQAIDLHTNSIGQYLVHEFISGNRYEAYLKRIRNAYRQKKNVMLAALEKQCSSFMTWNDPAGGYFIWCRLKDNVNAKSLMKDAFYDKVSFLGGESFFLEGKGEECLRLSFTYHKEKIIEEGIRRIKRAYGELKKREKDDKTRYRIAPIV